MTTQTSTNHLFACTVEEYDAGHGKKAKSWTRIGAAFPHKDGPGFNLELRALPVDGLRGALWRTAGVTRRELDN